MSHLILLPGLGADAQLFYPQQQYFGDRLTVIDGTGDVGLWQQAPSMAVAADMIIEHFVGSHAHLQNYVLGGMSFGGSLAIEIARRLKADRRCAPPAAIALIASNRTADSVSRGFRVNRAIGSLLPQWLVRRGLAWATQLFANREGLGSDDRQRLRDMAERTNLVQLMWGAKAIANWECRDADVDAIGVPVQQLHGLHDWVIPIATRHVTKTIPDGKHLITWTHRQQVNTWLDTIVSQDVAT